ncbi:MAG: DNA mismatch repair endonuclease MutL [Thermomicrobiales bacterium]
MVAVLPRTRLANRCFPPDVQVDAEFSSDLTIPPPHLGRSASRESAIRVLPTNVAAGIAAGETIERPASVVKELVENALDAGARSVRIDIRGGGLDLIRVGDDGEGLRAADLWLACQRHATSKYPDGGLASVRTLGFRGEALPSIAGVAELDLVSATRGGAAGGWRLTLRGGRVLRDEPAARAPGTTVTVRGLFADLPARRAAFAGTQGRAEMTHISAVVRRLALSAPDVRFSLYSDDRLVLQSSGTCDLLSAIAETHGQSLLPALLPLGPVEIGGARIHGAISGAEVTRSGRGSITLLVNGRPVFGRGLQPALEAAYRPLLPRGRHPVLVFVVEVDPRRVDVNVHPAKLEVRLRGEREIGQAMADLVRDALGRRPLALRWEPLTGAAALAQEAERAIAEEPVAWDDAAPIITPGLPPLRLLGQVGARLLLLEGDAGLYLVDQHRAHERILYERMRSAHAATDRERIVEHAPPLPEPLLIELGAARAVALTRRLPELAQLGFALEEFGGRAFLLRSAPVLPGVLPGGALDSLANPDTLADALLIAADEAEAGDGETWQERLLIRLSCRTAVRRGRTLAWPLMRALVEGLGNTGAPAVCPHGSPLLMHVDGKALERQFGWE